MSFDSKQYYQRNKRRIKRYYEANKSSILEKQKERWKNKREHMRYIKIKSLYGLTRQEYDDLVAFHAGKCAICERSARLNIDHNHKTGKVRGLLCAKCNKAIGLLEESVEFIKNAAVYLTEYNQDG